CYNLMTERLGPPTHKLTYPCPSLRHLNWLAAPESMMPDPQGFPLSEKLSTYNGGIRLNIRARMMACQAPYNWTAADGERFFTRHYYRSVLQRLFLDKGIISKITLNKDDAEVSGDDKRFFDTTTSPIILGALQKQCYKSWNAYVRGAVKKLTTSP